MFEGSIPALITPFKDGEIDERLFQAFVDWQIRQGSSALVPCGTTGESPVLSEEEHRRVIALCIEAAAGRVPVIAGVGTNNTATTIERGRHARKAGASGLLVVTPYYNKPSQEGLFAHFRAVAEAVDLPIIIYNIPGRSAVDMSVETMARLAVLDNIVGVKDATGDLARVSLQRAACGTEFVQLSGEDGTALGFNAMGGRGCISVTANVAPLLCAEFQAKMKAGDFGGALVLHDRLMPLHRALFCSPSPAPVKYAASRLGLCEAEVRLPLTELEEQQRQRVDAAMDHAGLEAAALQV